MENINLDSTHVTGNILHHGTKDTKENKKQVQWKANEFATFSSEERDRSGG